MESMASNRWEMVERIYHDALEQESGARSAFVSKTCGDDPELLKEVKALLEYDRKADQFIEVPAFELEAKQLAADGSVEKAPEKLPERIGPYVLMGLLGKGGMGEVHL